MSIPPPARFRGWNKWKHVLTYVAIAAAAFVLVAIVVAAVPRDVLAMQVLAAYTALGGLLSLVLAVALLLTRQLPAGREATLDGEPAVVFRAWRPQWWFEVATDVGLGLLGGVLFGLAATASPEWLLWGFLPLLVGLWFLARAGLALVGRRHDEALWITQREVVHDTAWGRERCARADVTDVVEFEEHDRLIIVSRAPVQRDLCPRPWRRAVVRVRDDDMGVDCSLMGHTNHELVRWLQETIPAGGAAAIRRH